MTGRRIDQTEEGSFWFEKPGDYGKDLRGVWHCYTPNELFGGLKNHEVTEHEDGTITVSPSILVHQGNNGRNGSWHGYLERGIWREC